MLCWMDIYIQLIKRDIDKKNRDGKTSLHQLSPISFKQRMPYGPVPDVSAVYINIKALGCAACNRGGGYPAGKRNIVIGKTDFVKILSQGFTEGIYNPVKRIGYQGPAFNHPAVVNQREMNTRPCQGDAGGYISDMPHFRINCF